MVVTEEEAKTKWCPQTGSSEDDADLTNCIGSGCMWWEWNADKDKGYCGVTKKVAR